MTTCNFHGWAKITYTGLDGNAGPVFWRLPAGRYLQTPDDNVMHFVDYTYNAANDGIVGYPSMVPTVLKDTVSGKRYAATVDGAVAEYDASNGLHLLPYDPANDTSDVSDDTLAKTGIANAVQYQWPGCINSTSESRSTIGGALGGMWPTNGVDVSVVVFSAVGSVLLIVLLWALFRRKS